MLELVLILAGGIVPLAVAYSVGKLCLPRAPDTIALGVGAALESLLVFALLAAGLAKPAVFFVLATAGVAPLAWLRPRPRVAAPRGPILLVFAAYGLLYLIHAMAPEIEPDGVSYHLGLVAEYARLGGFPDRVGFFEMLPQGMEMLFLFAFIIGKHSAAKLAHFGFLLATIPLMIEVGRRMRVPDRLSTAAAAFYFCAPVVGVTGTSSYNDAAGVFFTLATLLALLLWKQEGEDRYLLAAGLLAGFCYAIKMNGLLVPLLAAAFVASTRRLRPLRALAAAALLAIAPWMIRGILVAGNPIAPMGNAFFPSPYFHLTMEQGLLEGWRNYAGVNLASAPWELTMGSRLQGSFGSIFLLLPIGLLSLRTCVGRWTWLAAALLAIPWISNEGARFLMPSLPFLALALAMSLDALAPAVLWVCLAIHAVTCWPAVVATYQAPEAWKLHDAPWRAALRLESERDYLLRVLGEYEVVDLLREKTRSGEKTFALLGVPTTYTDRPIVDWWESALADRVLDTLKVASFYADDPFYDLRAEWPAEPLKGLRFRLTTAHPGEWDLNEVRLFSGDDRVYNSPQWQLGAWPNPWEAPVAFDDNFASRWRTWEPMRPGMFVEVLFDRPQRLTAAALSSHSPVYNVLVDFFGLDANGRWKLLSAHPAALLRRKEDLRRAAVRYLRRSGIDYILAPESTSGVWQLGKILVEQHLEWGLEDVGQRSYVHLLRIPKYR